MSKARGVLGALGPVARVDSHASAKTALAASVAFDRDRRLDSLNLKFMLGLPLCSWSRERPSAPTTQSRGARPNAYGADRTSVPLIGTDVVADADGAGDAVEVEQRHAAHDARGTAGGARVDRHGTTPEVVVPGHVPGVVHEQRAELGGRQRDAAGLGAAAAQVKIRRRVVVDDVVVVDVVRP